MECFLRNIEDLPFAQAAAIAHQSALGDCTEACQLLDEIILSNIEEQIADVDCWLWDRCALASWSHGTRMAELGSALHCFLDGCGCI